MHCRKRGCYVKKIIQDYCVVDIETTGLSYRNDAIIEIGIVKVRNGKIIKKYSQLINPHCTISTFITQLTGINNEMVANQPSLEEIKNTVKTLIGDDIIIGHNTSFDLSFIAYQMDWDIENEYMDTLQFSRKVYPQLHHHRLTDMVHFLNLSQNEHRSLADCIATYELYEHLKNQINQQNINI